MTSNTSSSDRRWASTRRGGMTVLGKVAVPKPINLPSQRLENHGLDPNVEIVPKGTLSWGSRSSSSTSNPWGSSALSPNTDGGANSPGRISTRPSSGETRPSTAGSDRVHDSTPSAWSSNSRPSSASGALTSSQTSLASLRPRSAETRPSSSQLSRFADLPTDTSAGRIGEKLGAASSKNDGFALSTGDFPTLGSIKSSSGKTADSNDHNSSSSADNVPTEEGTVNQDAGDAPLHNDGRSKVENAWRRDSEDSHIHGSEKWNGDPLHYQNSGIPPQHFGAWHGPSLNNPQGGVWFRGPTGGPPPFAGGPIPPGGFPMEPFPYFRPQLPTNARPNAQQPGNGPRGPHPNNGEMYRPHMPDAYLRPAMPLRPGFYPGPVPYDGYFGPPMGYCNPNERDIPLINMGGGPQAIYGQFPNQNAPDPRNSHVRSPVYGPNSKDSNQQGVDSSRRRDGPEQRKLLLKDRDGSGDEKVQEHKQEGIARAHESSVNKGERLAASSWDDWEGDEEKVTEHSRELSSRQFERKDGRSNLPLNAKTPELVEVSRVDRAPENRSDHKRVVSPDTPKDSTLIQKIQGLNAKARASDARQEVMVVSDRPVQGNKHISDAKLSSIPESGTSLLIGSVQLHSEFSMEEKRPVQTDMGGVNTSRRHPHGVLQGKGPHRAKGRYNMEDGDGWQKRSAASENSDPILPSPAGASSVLLQPCPASLMATGISASRYPQKDERGSLPGPPDNQAERAKMRELARQRVKQRQEEEEQRIRDQKAKARMKLEELERRRQVVESSKTEPENDNQLPSSAEATVTSTKSASNPAPTPASNSNVVFRTGVSVLAGNEKSSAAGKESSLQQDDGHINSTKVTDTNNSKPTRSNDKPKLNHASDSRSYIPKAAVEAHISEVAAENASTSIEVITKESTTSFEANVSVGSSTMADSSAHHKRKFNKNGRNKFKVDESASAPSVPLTVSKEARSVISSADSGKSQQSSESEKGLLPVQPPSKPADGSQQIIEQRPTSGSEEAQGKVNNQSKSQPSRRNPRNQQGSRASEKFHGGDAVVWAPVRSQSKTEVGDEHGEKVERLSSSAKSDNVVAQTSLRNKRAEMERYVPKPVAKEMAQQVVGVHQNTGVVDIQVKEEDGVAVQVGDSRLEKEARNLDGDTDRQSSKSGRGGHGSWRQRGPVVHHQSVPVRDEQSQSETARIVDNHDRQQHMPEKNIGKEESSGKYHDNWVLNEEPSSNSTTNSAPQEVVVPVVRDHQQGVGGKGRRYASKGQKAVGGPPGADTDQKKSNSRGDTEIRSSNNPLLAPETNAAPAAAPKENHGTGERNALHWQPKSRATSGHNYRVVNREELGGGALHHEKDNNKTAEAEKEQRPVNSFTGGPGYSRSLSGSVKPLSDVGEIVDHQEGGFSSGPRRYNGSQNFRPGSSDGNRGGEWNSNSRQHNNNTNTPPPPPPPQGGHRGERQRYNSQQQQLKYQPVGGMHQHGGDNRSSTNQFEGGSRDGPPGGSRRYKERGGGQGNSSRRGGGNFYERKGANDA